MTGKLVLRELYLRRLRENLETNDVVKVITGVRKAGKTTLLREFRDELDRNGALVLFYELESAGMSKHLTRDAMVELVYPLIPEDEDSFLLLDEVNEIEDWHKFINSLTIDRPRCNIFITGSNAYLLSSELSTYLSGKTKEINVLPFSFTEYLEKNGPRDGRFRSYLVRGALPQVDPDAIDEDYRSLMDGIYNTIIVKDVMERSDKSITYFRLKRIVAFVLESTGKTLSINHIAKKTKLSNVTVEKYIQLLVDAFLIYPVGSYSIRGMDMLDSPVKYYAVDNGLRSAALDYKVLDMGQLLETAVYLELRRRGYSIYVGNMDGWEIDFVAIRSREMEYFQVCYTMMSMDTVERELRPLRALKDHRRVTIVTADPLPQDFEDGIRVVNFIQWMDEGRGYDHY